MIGRREVAVRGRPKAQQAVVEPFGGDEAERPIKEGRHKIAKHQRRDVFVKCLPARQLGGVENEAEYQGEKSKCDGVVCEKWFHLFVFIGSIAFRLSRSVSFTTP